MKGIIKSKLIIVLGNILLLVFLLGILPYGIYQYMDNQQEKEAMQTGEYVKETQRIDFSHINKISGNTISFFQLKKLQYQINRMENNAFNVRSYLQSEYRETNSKEVKALLDNYNNYWTFMFEVKNNAKQKHYIDKNELDLIESVYGRKNVKALRKYEVNLTSDIYATVSLYYLFCMIFIILFYSQYNRNRVKNFIHYWFS